MPRGDAATARPPASAAKVKFFMLSPLRQRQQWGHEATRRKRGRGGVAVITCSRARAGGEENLKKLRNKTETTTKNMKKGHRGREATRQRRGHRLWRPKSNSLCFSLGGNKATAGQRGNEAMAGTPAAAVNVKFLSFSLCNGGAMRQRGTGRERGGGRRRYCA